MGNNTMAQPASQYISISDYLEGERTATEKHEYYKGEVYAMSGASLKHNRIQVNFTRHVANYLAGKGCDVFGSDLRVHIPSNSLFTYPDAVIICGKPELLDNTADTVLNPVIIVEILSKSTQSYDRGDKFNLYRAIPSLQEYILINSEAIGIEHYSKQENHSWLLQDYQDMAASFLIKSIELQLPLAQLYEGVVF
jgi:Uma2 family endonuclease